MISKEDLLKDFHASGHYQLADDETKDLLDWAYQYGFEDGETEAHVSLVGFNGKVADQLRGIAYDLENPQ